jgi:site-specific DNA-methyltransferase (adenine-specific)
VKDSAKLCYNTFAVKTKSSLRRDTSEVTPVERRAAVGRSAQEPTEATQGRLNAAPERRRNPQTLGGEDVKSKERERLTDFFKAFASQASRILVPGGHLVIAANPLLSTTVFAACETSGMEKRGELIRVIKTLRGGDRPKGAEKEFSGVSVMPRSSWEPWGLFRKPISEKTVAANLRKWGTGGFRRISDDEPFRDLFECAPAPKNERALAPHPSLKPQKLMRYIVNGVLPLGKGIVYDPFSGSGSTLAAAAHLGLAAVGTERDVLYFEIAAKAIPKLARLP